MKVMGVADFLEEYKYKLHDGKMWGRWKFRADNLTLEYQDHGHYYVDLERCTTSAQILDWILQIAGKGWIAEEDLGYLVRGLDELFDGLQGKVCPWGIADPSGNQEFNPTAFLKLAIDGQIR